jgi:integrase
VPAARSPSKRWFCASKDAWHVEFHGKQIRLAKGRDNEKAARDAFYKLMASGSGKLPEADTLRVATVCDLFLDHSEKHHVPDTFAWYKQYLQDFCDLYRMLLAQDLKPLHVSRWLNSHPGWKGARRCAVIAIKRAFNWAAGEGLLALNPPPKVKKPPQTFRQRVLTREERQEVMAAIRDQAFRDFVFAIQETGCRPSEVARVTAAHVNLELGVWVFADRKTVKKTGKPRIVYLTPAIVELTKRPMADHPEGPLFRGPRGGRPFTRIVIRCRFRRLRQKLPHLKGLIAYAYRHSFATDALVNGVGIAQVAELLRHTSTEMVMRHYSLIAGKIHHTREAAMRAAKNS